MSSNIAVTYRLLKQELLVDGCIQVILRACKKFTFDELMAVEDKNLHNAYLEQSTTQVFIRIDDKSDVSIGAMKQMRRGQILDPIQSGCFAGISDVAVKQAYHEGKTKRDKIYRRLYTGDSQLMKLAPELTCAAWAHALFEFTKQYVNQVISRKGNPPFEVPDMRFVAIALATEIDAGGVGNSYYLLEELIKDREFVKYIHNGSAAIALEKTTEPFVLRGEYLAFTQHHQYWKTYAQAFISDYQGMFLRS